MTQQDTLQRIAPARRPTLLILHPSAFILLLCLCLAIGCDAVQEDRHVQFSQSGNQVAFQHGSDGIFVADPQTGELRKVFDPDPSIVAVSTPLWSDDETQAIFTTSRPEPAPNAPPQPPGTASPTAPAAPAAMPPAWDDAPQGRFFFPQAIVYTCWLLERPAAGAISKPVRLFEAHCNHSGYVAGNLAVRWQPKQKKILFVDRDPNAGHAVWLFDLATKHKSKLFPQAGQTAPAHVLADFLPDGTRVVCVATAVSWTDAQPLAANASKQPRASTQPRPSASGIWIGSTDGSNWWHVPESAQPERGNVAQGLSNLISQRPAPTKDGRQFAFLREATAPTSANPTTKLFRARIAERNVQEVFKTTGEICDLHWSPDGAQLGLLLADPKPHLRIIDAAGHSRDMLTEEFVRDFVGWNAAGDKLACVVTEKTDAEKTDAEQTAAKTPPTKTTLTKTPPTKTPPPKSQPNWAFLLLPDPLARDAVLIVDRQGAARQIASGLRFTFPQWSSKRDQLSMWGTFEPTHRSLPELGGGLSLRPGDPAAIVDVSTGAIRWLAINGDELAQVGHYFLLKHDFAQAREWYRKADKRLPKLEPLRPADLQQGVSGAAARRRMFEFFYAHCLTKLGESKEAASRLALFDSAYRIEWPSAALQILANEPTRAWSSVQVRHETETFVAIAKALAIAQVFLSVDNADAAEAWFRGRLESADKTEQLADLMVLSQFCLFAKHEREYANLVTDRLAPLLDQTLSDPPSNGNNFPRDGLSAVRANLAFLAAHALGPLFCESFLKDLPADFVSQLVPKWEALRGRSKSRVVAFYADLCLRAAAARLGHEKERAAAAARIAENPVRSRLLLPEKIEPYFTGFAAPDTLREGGHL